MARRDPDTLGAFLLKWAIAVHRAIWFPVNRALGLEARPAELPMDISLQAVAREADSLRETVVIARGSGVSRPRS